MSLAPGRQQAAIDLTAAISLQSVYKRFPTPTGASTRRCATYPHRRARRVLRRRRPDRLRQVDHPDAHLRPGTPQRRRGARDGASPSRASARRIGYIFQADAVFPWKSVLQQRRRRPALPRRAQSARPWSGRAIGSRRVGLSGFEHHYPHQLSGGMRKRVALAQTLITEPQILLMDEPFSALDVQTRALMEDELLELWSATSASVVFVTHDLEEAIALADRVCVLTAGPAHGQGHLYHRPAAAAQRGRDPLRAALHAAVSADLGSSARRGDGEL